MPTKKQDPGHQTQPALDNLEKPQRPERMSKQALLLELIEREGGATLEELTSATAWLPHTVRAALTGLRKRGHDISRVRIESVSRYFVRSNGE
jgi:hypothetical protein